MTHVPNDDEISAFFSHITPDAVIEEPKETHIRTIDSPADLSDPTSFEEFWLTRLGEFSAHRKHFSAIHDGQRIHFYAHRPGERDWDYVQRIKKDAERLDAKWAFICHPGRAARGGDAGGTNVNDESAVEKMKDHLFETTLWYAAGVGHEEFYGVVQGDEVIQSSNPNGASPHLREVLKGMA